MRFDWIAYGALAMLVLIWGGTFASIRLALEGFSPMAVVVGRMALAMIIVVSVTFATGQRLPNSRTEWAWTAFLGLINFAIPFSLMSWGQLSVPSSITATYISAIPLFVLLFSWIILGEKISLRKWVGFTVGFAGLVYLAHPWQVLAEGGSLLPHLAIILATIGMALGSIVIRKMPNLHPLTAMSGAFIVSTLASLPFGIVPLLGAEISMRPLVGLLVLGIASTGIAQVLRFFTVKRTSAVFVSVVGYLIPIWAGVLGVWIFDEVITRAAILAYALIIVGLLIARDRKRPA